jgi:xanthine dehydrogenase accessory factor
MASTKELRQILQLWEATARQGESAVLATVVKTQGSSYRLPGARLLVSRAGIRAGSVSGGCLEDDLVKKAWWLTESGPAVRRYDTNGEGEIGTGFGLGCNGVIHVSLERLSPSVPNVLERFADCSSKRVPFGIAHVVSGGHSLTIDEIELQLDRGDPEVDAHVLDSLKNELVDAVAARESRSVLLEDAEYLVEVVTPPIRLLIVGAGDDSIPLTTLAGNLGWSSMVFDGRAHYAKAEKFGAGVQVVSGPVDRSLSQVSTDPWTVAVLMTHSYSQDLQALRTLLPQSLRYLGILGPRKRTEQLMADVSCYEPQLQAALHSPVGLDIGADGPEQVALAIVAEIQAVLNQRSGGQLRHRRDPIHAHSEEKSSEVWLASPVCF